MSSINFPGKQIQTVLLDPSSSPKHYGVGQWEDQIWAVSPCCKERVLCNITRGKWDCDGCGDSLQSLDEKGGPVSSMVYVVDSVGDIRWFTHRWTGIEEKLLKVEKGEW